MSNNYILFSDKSANARDMEVFFKKNNVPYIIVYKDPNSHARVFSPDDGPCYKEKDFRRLKSIILEGLEEKVE